MRNGNPAKRTCIGCRKTGFRQDLLRLVLKGTKVMPDPDKSTSGRGAWIHPNSRCVQNTLKTKSYVRALRCRDALVDGLEEEITCLFQTYNS